MANVRASAAKHEYDKPRLKEQIDKAMQSFLKGGKEVERVPTLIVPEPLALLRGESVIPDESN